MPRQPHGYVGPLHPHYEYDPDCECGGTGRHADRTYECGVWVIDPNEPTQPELAGMLRAHARGEYALEATAELLVAHDHWLRVREFLKHVDVFLAYTRPGRGPDTPRALIRWTDVIEGMRRRELVGSRSELDILRIACSLASTQAQVCLRTAMSGLDDSNIRIVVRAISHAAGNRQEWSRR